VCGRFGERVAPAPLSLKIKRGFGREVGMVERSGSEWVGVDKALKAAGTVMNSVDEELSGNGGPGETRAVPAAV
jgi:hypothetical protein